MNPTVPPEFATIEGLGQVRPTLPPQPLAMPTGLGGGECLAYACPAQPHQGCVSPAVARRLSRLQLLTLTAAHRAVQDGGGLIAGPGAGVFVGTGLGSLGATVEFLEDVIRRDEASPMPARFITSVHNASASAIAIEFQCQGENRTTTHDSISFELALGQALTALRLGRIERAVVAAGDELHPYHVAAMNHCQPWRKKAEALAPLSPTAARLHGSLPGEGAAAFVLGRPGGNGRPEASVCIRGLGLAPRPAADLGGIRTEDEVAFLQKVLHPANATLADVDLILLGADGDAALDAVYGRVIQAVGAAAGGDLAVGVFKHLCGEFATASALGLALAGDAVRQGRLLPDIALIASGRADNRIDNVLTYTIHRNGFHSACWVSR